MRGLGVFLFFLLWASASWAATEGEESQKGTTGLPLPRFASLRADEVNLRTGPGTRYPIDWVFVREGIPVEITAEFDIWRRVRDWEGAEGWVHKSALSGRRTVVVTSEAPVYLQKEDNATSAPVALIDPGVIGQVLGCNDGWCEIKFASQRGYLPESSFWGTYRHERIN